FTEVSSSGKYVAYKNENLLPFVRTTNNVFLEEELENASPVAKEQAMLTGIVLEEGNSNKAIPESNNLIKHTSIETVNSAYKNGILKVEEEGGVDLILNKMNPSVKDYYIKFHMKGIKNKEEFTLQVNDFITTRKEAQSIYRTNVDEILIRVKAEERISLRVPKGTYELGDFELYEETYEILEKVKEESNQNSISQLNWSGNRLSFTYQNDGNKQYAAIPLPYEKGWTLKINGEKQEIKKANYAFTGMNLHEGKNEVELVYYPPYFFQLLIISISSICIVLFIYRRKKILHT
ncbi:MAG TPA: YfhO family protein, partial [Metabacillus sp.]|nr:YfhO family protein [Metabacillus sp.]